MTFLPDFKMTTKRFIIFLTAGITGLNLCIIGLSWTSIAKSKAQYTEKAAITAQNLAQVFEQNLSGTISKIDIVILGLAHEIERQLAAKAIDSAEIAAHITLAAANFPEIQGLRVTNSIGEVIYSVPMRPRVSVADRDYFKTCRDNPTAGLVVSKPLIARYDNSWIIIVARRINGPDGSFAGVVFGRLPLETISRLFSSVNVGKFGYFALRDGADLGLVCRYPEPEGFGSAIGHKNMSSEFTALLNKGETIGTYDAPASSDKRVRTWGYRKFKNNRYYIFVGLAKDEYLAQWRRETVKTCLFIGLFFLGSTIAGRVIFLGWYGNKIAHDLLRDNEESLRLYIERLPLASIKFGPDFVIQSWNPAAENVFGFSREEAVGTSARELIIPAGAQIQGGPDWQELFRDQSGGTGVIENITKDNRIILCEWTNSPSYDSEGRMNGVISVVQDITGRKKTEDMMVRNEKMATIAGMAAGMAHEVNNPLGVIAQDLQNLERRFSNNLPANCSVAEELGVDLNLINRYMERREIHRYVSNMKTAVKRASVIISSMLQFSRQSDASHHLLDVNDIIEQSIKLAANDYDLRKKYDFKRIQVVREYDTNLPKVSVCLTEIQQVVINLLKNAAQAMFGADTEKPTILIRTFLDNGHVVVSIRDYGPGMSEAISRRIFDPFFTTKEVGDGTGLGLSVSHTIIARNHGGQLTVESVSGQGCCFSVSLPLIHKE